ncbi:hypothetical protein FNYG_09959 [Fusarium nygamai]|uniref:Uncharacterized protein n=1 Tax=Gibberella nygamai TaxID=42673 RepID=A0A2K0W2N8_GIBNY|nr:hypothetical protein FNYG_09959 [Fusarium nygamai]
MGNYRRMLDSMSEHQYATAVTGQELLHSFLENKTLREEEDHRRQTQKAKSMDALGADLAKAKEDLLTTYSQGSELRPKTSDEEWSEYLATKCNVPVEDLKQSKQLSSIESAALANSDPYSRVHRKNASNFEIRVLLKLAEIQ